MIIPKLRMPTELDINGAIQVKQVNIPEKIVMENVDM